jgi:aryl-alcohol dehydrogenase-like predicted oxidoreductase
MIKQPFGNTGYNVSILGFGAGHIGRENQDEQAVGKFLNEILDLGINFIDTARAYGNSEERIGKFISHRRQEFIISSKGGYTCGSHPDWTFECVTDNIEESLRRLKTDFIEIYHLHSCSKEILEKGEVIRALEKAKQDGKIGVAAFSGENEALDFALESGRFGSIQCSVNICDQHAIDQQVKRAAEAGLGVIGKRPIANAPWRFDAPPVGHYSAEYWYRFREMNMQNFGMDWNELAIRFSAFTPGVSTIITGTSSREHFLQNLEYVQKGPLPEEIVDHLKKEFHKNDKGWEGLI